MCHPGLAARLPKLVFVAHVPLVEKMAPACQTPAGGPQLGLLGGRLLTQLPLRRHREPYSEGPLDTALVSGLLSEPLPAFVQPPWSPLQAIAQMETKLLQETSMFKRAQSSKPCCSRLKYM